MFLNIRVLRLVPGFLAATLVAGVPAPAAADPCETFEGLVHCPVGSAALSQKASELEVEMFDSGDGVSIQLDDVRSWSSLANFEGDSGRDARLLTTALADGTAVSSASLARDGGTVGIAARFTGSGSGSTYSVMIYDDGVLKAASGGHANSTQAASILFSPCLLLGGIEGTLCDLVWEFHNASNDGSCMFLLAGDRNRDFVFELDGTQVRGDEIRLVEEIDPNSGYPYQSFDEIVLQGTGDAIRFLSESTGR